MSNGLLDFIKQLNTKRVHTYRFFRHGDPAKGIEYNTINTTLLVSMKIWSVDIARTPQVVRNQTVKANVNGKVIVANKINFLINKKSHKCKGRGI